MYRADRTLCRIELSGNLQPEIRGSKGRILGTIRDVTELRKSEETLRDSAKRLGELAAIVASSDDVIVSKDLNGIITSWNDAATRVFGYTADEMIGTSILKLIPEHLHSDEKTIIENIRAGRRVEHFETVRLTKDGKLIDVSLTVSPVKDANGQVIGASKILRDISNRKRLEQSLLQAEKIAATGRMAATIAHEINNPLEAVMNLLFLLRPKIADEEGINYLATAESELGAGFPYRQADPGVLPGARFGEPGLSRRDCGTCPHDLRTALHRGRNHDRAIPFAFAKGSPAARRDDAGGF